jgi:hypothetical protein
VVTGSREQQINCCKMIRRVQHHYFDGNNKGPLCQCGPSLVLDCQVLSWQAVALSAGGDGGGRSPEHQAQSVYVVFAAASDCRTSAIYEFTP